MSVTLTSRCQPAPADGEILLPKNAAVPTGRRTLVFRTSDDGTTIEKLMKAGKRGDSGESACVTGSALDAFGGEGAKVEYRGIGLVSVVIRDTGLTLQFLIAVATFLLATITAYATFIKDSAENAHSFAHRAAVLVFVLAFFISAAKFAKEIHDL